MQPNSTAIIMRIHPALKVGLHSLYSPLLLCTTWKTDHKVTPTEANNPL